MNYYQMVTRWLVLAVMFEHSNPVASNVFLWEAYKGRFGKDHPRDPSMLDRLGIEAQRLVVHSINCN